MLEAVGKPRDLAPIYWGTGDFDSPASRRLAEAGRLDPTPFTAPETAIG